MATKEKYKAPRVTAVSFRVERGFDTSSVSSIGVYNEEFDDRQMETFQTRSGWGDDGGNSFWD